MRFLAVDDGNSRALSVILSVVTDPSLPEHLMSEAEFVISRFRIVRVLGERIVSIHFERMRCGAESDNGSTTIQVVVEVFHLLAWEILESQKNDSKIRCIQSFHSRHIGIASHDLAAGLVYIEKHRALETVMLGQDACQFGQRLF